MNITLWVLQFLLALHTTMGAVWKVTNSEESVASLKIIPHAVWQLLSLVEVLCALALIIPAFTKKWGFLVPIASATIAVEMLIFCVLHLASGEVDHSPMNYWLVVAAICAFITYGRLKLKPL